MAALVASAGAAFAQSHIPQTGSPERVDGGWIYWLAFLSLALALVLIIFLIAAYMRYAPRFAKDEDEARVVHADRVVPGREAPRRMVDVTQAVPLVVQPPPVTVAAPASAPSAPARPRAGSCSGPAPAAAPAATPEPAAAGRLRRRLPPPPPRRPRSARRCRWTKRRSTRRSRNCSRPGPIVGSPRAKRDGPR